MYHGPLRTTTPAVAVNDDLVLTADHHAVLSRHRHRFMGSRYRDALIPTDPPAWGGIKHNFFHDYYKHCFLCVITETVGDYPYAYFSEKVWKTVASLKPFMIVGAQNSLCLLRSFGFRTFGAWWDESYDQEPTVALRIQRMIDQLARLSKLTAEQLRDMRVDMSDTINYNYRRLAEFKAQDLQNIRDSI
jgi:hypothetical protein